MRILKVKTLFFAAFIGLTALTACGDDNNDPDPEPGPEEITELKDEITKDLTLKNGKEYTLTGGVHVKNGVTLTIEPGVKIIAKDDDTVDYILIEQGGKINAQGTSENPIIMTSERKEPGAWGGLHICGYAPTNIGTTGVSEIGDAKYGGTNAADNSGTLRYIRLEYTGYAFSEEKEANGVTFYGVGNGTTVEYLQAYKGSDDGFEWFGGTVNAKYLIATDCSDDSFDWTEGWTGKAQFLVAYQGTESNIGYECDCLIEADNNGKNFAAQPVSCPVIANLTLIGNSSGINKRGVRLRAGTHMKIYNTLITGKENCLTTETAETEQSLIDGNSELDYIFITSGIKSGEGIYSEELFVTETNNAVNQEFKFTQNFIGTIEGGKNMKEVDSFFDNAAFKGAVDTANNWTNGWTL